MHIIIRGPPQPLSVLVSGEGRMEQELLKPRRMLLLLYAILGMGMLHPSPDISWLFRDQPRHSLHMSSGWCYSSASLQFSW